MLTIPMCQTNVKGTMIATKVFLPTANPTRAAVVALTAAVVFPAATLVNLSAYISSKLTLIKVMEFLAAENPTVFAAALHPGMVDTSILRSSGADPSKLPIDSGKQCNSAVFILRLIVRTSGSPCRVHGLVDQSRSIFSKWSLCVGKLGR
jgi:NAD(P)-dependent dehydrogenase (short-subunit alcohol dehydrogenase family)